jgi:hypothetical protein
MLARLLPLLLLCALLPPRGARMVWCLCFEPPESACCAGRCCPPADGDGQEHEHGAGQESDCCLAFELADFEEQLAGEGPAVPTLLPLARVASEPSAFAASLGASPSPACNGPPLPVPPAGLLAGVKPLRI